MTSSISAPRAASFADSGGPAAALSAAWPPDESGVMSSLRSPLFAAVAFVAVAVPVCADPVLATTSGSGEWTGGLPLITVILLAVLACLVQAVAVSLLATRPVLGLLAATGLYLAVAVLLGVPTWATPMQLLMALAAFALATSRPVPLAIAWSAGVTAATLGVLASWALASGAPPASVVAFLLTEGAKLVSVGFAGVVLGLLWASRERRTRIARARAREVERAQDQAVEASRAAERGRIAQELHDVAGQHLAGLVSLCDASLELAPAHPAEALELIEEVRAEGRYAAASLYGALGDLRAANADRAAPTPDLHRVEELVAFWAERGMPVTLRVEGDRDPLPAVVSTTAYRAVQEGLSNAAKHAPGGSVQVVVLVTEDRLRIEVVNGPARRKRPSESDLGLGWGLQGVREKLNLVDATLHGAADDAGGWRMWSDIPLPRTAGADLVDG